MDIHLTPELQAVVQRKVEAGDFPDADTCVASAILLLEEQDRLAQEHRDEISRKIDKGWQQSERDEVVSSKEVWAKLDVLRAAWLAANGRNAA